MYLNLLGLGCITFFLSYLAYNFSRPVLTKKVERSGLLVAQDSGKSKQIASKTGDASMRTEFRRRQTIQTVGAADRLSIKETMYQKGSTTGAIETFLLTSISPRPITDVVNFLYDAGGANDNYCNVLDDTGVGAGYDAGTAYTNVCAPAIFEINYDAGGSNTNYCDVLDDNGIGCSYDAGSATTRVCGK